MKEPKRIPLTDNPKIKEPQKIRLLPQDNKILDEHEDNQQNNKTSIQQLESNKTS